MPAGGRWAVKLACIKNRRIQNHQPAHCVDGETLYTKYWDTFRPHRCHQLSGDRDEEFAIDIVHPFRLVFEVAHDPIPRDEFGGVDKERVTAIRFLEVTDYH